MIKRANILIVAVLIVLMFTVEFLPSRLNPFQRKPTAAPAAARLTVIRFGGDESFAYNPSMVTIAAGESVEWQGNFSSHPLASDTQLWYPNRSGTTFSQTFKNPGTYRFYCENHGAPNGGGMSGVIVVQ